MVEAGQTEAGPAAAKAIALTRCSIGYTAAVSIGTSQTFHLLVDTGSTTLAVASSACTSCTGVSPRYQPGPSAVDEHMQGSSQFLNGTWSGEIYQDSVGVGSEATVPVKLLTIDTLSMAPTAPDQPGVQGILEPGQPGVQGILGLALAGVAVRGTTGLFDQLVTTGVPNVFATELCDTTGTLWLGGYDSTFATAAPQYVPFIASPLSNFLYVIELSSIAVGGTSVTATVGTASYPDSMIDTGTPGLVVPSTAFSSLTAAIGSSPGFVHIFGSGASWFAGGSCATLSETADALNAALPSLTLTFGSVSIEALPTESYLTEYEGKWCPSLFAMDPTQTFPFSSIVGSPVLRSNIVIFDRAHKRIGFAPHRPCP